MTKQKYKLNNKLKQTSKTYKKAYDKNRLVTIRLQFKYLNGLKYKITNFILQEKEIIIQLKIFGHI